MDSPSGVSSNSSVLLNSTSEEDLQQLMDQRKRKRMISNRDSARRSRLRKQLHKEGLMAQMAQLRKENHQILTGLNATAQSYTNVEAENAVLRAQVAELSQRLYSLNKIVGCAAAAAIEPAYYGMAEVDGLFGSCWSEPAAVYHGGGGTAEFMYY